MAGKGFPGPPKGFSGRGNGFSGPPRTFPSSGKGFSVPSRTFPGSGKGFPAQPRTFGDRGKVLGDSGNPLFGAPTAPVLRPPPMVGHRNYPEGLLKLREEHSEGKPPNQALPGAFVIMQRKSLGVLSNAPKRCLNLLPKLPAEAGALLLVIKGCLLQVPLGFRVEHHRIQG